MLGAHVLVDAVQPCQGEACDAQRRRERDRLGSGEWGRRFRGGMRLREAKRRRAERAPHSAGCWPGGRGGRKGKSVEWKSERRLGGQLRAVSVWPEAAAAAARNAAGPKSATAIVHFRTCRAHEEQQTGHGQALRCSESTRSAKRLSYEEKKTSHHGHAEAPHDQSISQLCCDGRHCDARNRRKHLWKQEERRPGKRQATVSDNGPLRRPALRNLIQQKEAETRQPAPTASWLR